MTGRNKQEALQMTTNARMPAGPSREPRRCRCGRLVCEVRDHEVRIKCGRCKRIVVIVTEGVIGMTFEEAHA